MFMRIDWAQQGGSHLCLSFTSHSCNHITDEAVVI